MNTIIMSMICSTALLMSTTHANPKNETDLFSLSLEELFNIEITSASFRRQSVVKSPSKVRVMSKKHIKDRNYRYLADVIADLPAVRLSLYAASADSGSSEMIVRGIRGNNKVVLMWNGQRLNHPDAQPLHITPYLYPLDDIDQIEVIYGSASALYGSDTVSLTMNMISSPSSETKHTNWTISLDAGRYNEKKGTIKYTGNFDNFSAELLLNKYETDGIDFSDFEQFYSRYPNEAGINASYTFFPKEQRADYYHPSEESITAKLRLEAGELALQTYFQRFQTQTQIGWSPLTYEANGDSGQYIFKQLGFYLTHKLKLNNGVILESLVDHTRNQLNPYSHWNRPNMAPFRIYSSALEPRGVGTRTYKLNYANRTKIEERINWQQLNNKLHSVIGLSLTTVDMLPKTGNLDFPASYDDSISNQVDDRLKFHNLAENNLGIFAQTQYDYSKKLTFTLGGRYDKHNRYGNTFNPRLVVNYFNNQTNWFIKGIAGTSYLAPAAFFTFDTFFIPRSAQQVPNTELKPEETTDLELNLGKNFKKFAIEASLFKTKVDNLIMQRQIKSIEQLTDEQGEYTFTTTHTINSGKTDIYGFNLELESQLTDNISPSLSYSFVTGQTTDKTNNEQSYDLIHTPRNQLKFTLDSKWFNSALALNFDAKFTDKAKYHPDNYRFPALDNNGTQFEMSSFWIFDFGGSYQFTDNISMHFNITNLTDKKYDQPIVGQETSSWTRIAATPGTPRQFYIGLKLSY